MVNVPKLNYKEAGAGLPAAAAAAAARDFTLL